MRRWETMMFNEGYIIDDNKVLRRMRRKMRRKDRKKEKKEEGKS